MTDGWITTVEVVGGVNGIQYSRIYLFELDDLIFTIWAGDEQHRLYFAGNHLFRWSHTLASGENIDYGNRFDLEEFNQWDRRAFQDINDLWIFE